MDLKVEEKLDNFEAVVSSFEDKFRNGEHISDEQITILQSALLSIISRHTIASWWKEEISNRISDMKTSMIRTMSTPSGNNNWAWELYNKEKALYPALRYRNRNAYPEPPTHQGERFFFNRNMTPRLTEELKNIKLETKKDEIRNQITEEQKSWTDAIRYFVSGGRPFGKGIWRREYHGFGDDIS